MQSALTDRRLLVLDLDETLVHTVEAPLAGRVADFRVGEFHVYKRPHVDAFLTRMGAVFNLAIWSKGGTGYVEPTIRLLFAPHAQPLFVWSFPRCTRRYDQDEREAYHIKDLKKVRQQGFPSEHTLIVDDDARNAERNFGQAVTIKAFTGELDDCELLHLATYLESLVTVPNFRTVEKRYWRNQFVA
ncbi:MAG: HAD family hydrolase [Candidatus Melainabacteria bacterium]|nr:HAD family hydrolase [Candidatus Melainabacteria bacterium]